PAPAGGGRPDVRRPLRPAGRRPAAAGETFAAEVTPVGQASRLSSSGQARRLSDDQRTRRLMHHPRSLPLHGQSICPYCGVGCRLDLEGEVGPYAASLKIRGVADAPANLGRICAKGALLGETILAPDRLTQPMVRPTRQEPFRPAAWDGVLKRL